MAFVFVFVAAGLEPNGTHFVSGKTLAAGIPTAYSL